MNRIDRLTAILLLLQGEKRSASEIARRFEVSRRPIQRDIDALCEMGISIVAEPGSGGGYSLPPDYSLPSLALTLHEAFLLHLALSSLSQLSETPFCIYVPRRASGTAKHTLMSGKLRACTALTVFER